MKKYFLILALLGGLADASRAAITFETSHTFQIFNDKRWQGTNRHFGFLFTISDDVEMGYFFEEALWDWRGSVGAVTPNFTNLTTQLNGLRALKKFNNYLSAGFDIGTAQMAVRAAGGTNATIVGAAPLSQTKPFVDVLGRIHYSVEKEKVSSGVHLDLSYRFLDLNDVVAEGALAAAGSGESTLDDLHAFNVALGVHLSF